VSFLGSVGVAALVTARDEFSDGRFAVVAHDPWEHNRATLFSPAVIPRAGSSSEMKRYPNAGSSV